MLWVKRLCDHVIQDPMGHPGLEFAWGDLWPGDPAEQAKVIDIYVRDGIYAVNEARGLLGLDPVPGGDQPMIYGAQGATPLGASSVTVGKRAATGSLGKADFDPAEPRVPAGDSDGGQWTGDSDEATAIDAGHEKSIVLAQAQTCQEFIAENCQASILRIFPGQFLHVPLDQVLEAAKAGDAAARTAKKLLFENRFRK
jgi:hypothetical protein